MAITKEWLKKVSISQSFSKGKDYYEQVENLVKKGNTYSADVFGSNDYEVSITDNPSGEPSSYCDCPYDKGGICKHIVAVGLNIIDGNYEDEGAASLDVSEIFSATPIPVGDAGSVLVEKTDSTFAQHSADTFYDAFFLKQDVMLRMNFLRQLFANDEKLRRQFFEYCKPREANAPTMTIGDGNIIEKTAEKLNKKLAKLSDTDTNDYYESSEANYDDEGDGIIEWFEQKVENVFLPFKIELKLKILNGELAAATDMLVGMYEGCLSLEFEGDLCDFYDEGDYEGVALGFLENVISEVKEQLKTTIFNENAVKQSASLLLNRWSNRKDEAEVMGFFEDYFIGISNKKETAQWLLGELKQKKLTPQLINLTLHIADVMGDDALWINAAEQVAPEKQAIMQLLLDRYFETNRMLEFHRTANVFLKKYADGGAINYLKPKVSVAYDKALYIQVHLQSAAKSSSLDDYLKARPLLSDAAIRDFMKKCQKESQNLYVAILHENGDFEGILTFIKNNQTASSNYYSSYAYGFNVNGALEMIVSHYPQEVFDIVKNRVTRAVDSMKMSRSGYTDALENLNPLKTMPKTHSHLVRNLVSALQTKFPGRPAFLDELRKIKL